MSSQTSSAWFEDVNQAANKCDLADPRYLYERSGVIELKSLALDNLVQITRDTYSSKTEGRTLRELDKSLATALKRYDGEGRPLYAYFLGQAFAEGGHKDTWQSDDLLKFVLSREQKKRWSTKFDGRPPSLGSNDEALHLSIVATICGGISRERMVKVHDMGAIDDELFERALVLTGGPIERGVLGAAEFVPPMQPDILGEWFALSSLRLRPQAMRTGLISEAWATSAIGMARFIQRVASDFPKLGVQLGLFDESLMNNTHTHLHSKVAGPIALALLQAEQDIPKPVIAGIERAVKDKNAQAMNILGYLKKWLRFGKRRVWCRRSVSRECFEWPLTRNGKLRKLPTEWQRLCSKQRRSCCALQRGC